MTTHIIDSNSKLNTLHYNTSIIQASDILEIRGDIDASRHNGRT